MTVQVILASSSKSRLSLLKQINIIPDLVISPDIDETPKKSENPLAMIKRLAKEKGDKVAAEHRDKIVISADTVSIVAGKMLIKTYSPEQELEYLNLISGKRHRLHSAVCVQWRNQKYLCEKIVTSSLKFKRLTKQEIEEYIASDQWKGCSGGYAIEGLAGKYLAWLSGSFSNVLGLPLYEVNNMLTACGFYNKK